MSAFPLALLVATVGVTTLSARVYVDRRTIWWTRAQWAIDLALSPDPVRRRVGIDLANRLVRSRWTNRADRALARRSLRRARAEDSRLTGEHDGQTPPRGRP